MSEVILQSRDVRAVLRGMSVELFESLALPLLRERGWIFSKPGVEKERPIDLCNRLGISSMTLDRRLKSPNLPEGVVIEYTAGGNRHFIHKSDALDAFLTDYCSRLRKPPIP